MDPADGPERPALTVPLGAVGSSSGRARLAVVAWTITLAAISWMGWAGRDAPSEAPVATAPVALVPATAPAAASTTAPATATVPRGTVRYVTAPVVVRHSQGEDGLVGGIVFRHNVPVLSQADIERDGYRYYHALVASHSMAGRPGSR